MSRFVITPWRTQQDLLEVRGQLYRLNEAEAIDQRRHAVHRVMAWRLRGNLPHAVESTALLVDAFLHHDIPANSSFSIRAVYSAAFCRFVTGFCDIGRNRERSLEPSSMLEIAKQIDMPVEFVALRHEATHEELPNEDRLVAACEHALHWLWRVYWSRIDQDSAEDVVQDEAARTEKCVILSRKVFRQYRSKKRDLLKQRAGAEKIMEETFVPNNAIQQECGEDKAMIDAVMTDLVDSHLLIPSDKTLKSSLEGAFLVWDDLLLLLMKGSAYGDALIAAILRSISSGKLDDSQQEAYHLWLEHISCSAKWSADKQLRTKVRSDVMKHCVLHANVWTANLGSKLLESGDAIFREQWQSIFDASQQSVDAMQIDEQQSIKNLPGAKEPLGKAEKAMDWHRMILPPTVPLGVVAS